MPFGQFLWFLTKRKKKARQTSVRSAPHSTSIRSAPIPPGIDIPGQTPAFPPVAAPTEPPPFQSFGPAAIRSTPPPPMVSAGAPLPFDPAPAPPGPAGNPTWTGSYTGHVVGVILLTLLAGLSWIVASAFGLLIVVFDSIAFAGATPSDPSSVLINMMIFGWVGPALVLLVGLLGVQGLGQRGAVTAAAGVFGLQILTTFLVFTLFA